MAHGKLGMMGIIVTFLNSAWYVQYDGYYCGVSKWRMVHSV